MLIPNAWKLFSYVHGILSWVARLLGWCYEIFISQNSRGTCLDVEYILIRSRFFRNIALNFFLPFFWKSSRTLFLSKSRIYYDFIICSLFRTILSNAEDLWRNKVPFLCKKIHPTCKFNTYIPRVEILYLSYRIAREKIVRMEEHLFHQDRNDLLFTKSAFYPKLFISLI